MNRHAEDGSNSSESCIHAEVHGKMSYGIYGEPSEKQGGVGTPAPWYAVPVNTWALEYV